MKATLVSALSARVKRTLKWLSVLFSTQHLAYLSGEKATVCAVSNLHVRTMSSMKCRSMEVIIHHILKLAQLVL